MSYHKLYSLGHENKFEKHKPQVAQAHYESSEQPYPTQLINYSTADVV